MRAEIGIEIAMLTGMWKSRFMPFVLAILFIGMLSTPSWAKKAKGLPPLLKKIEAKYVKAGSLKAKFSQDTFSQLSKTNKKTEGEIWVKFPDRVKWNTYPPNENLLVGNGKLFWFYTPPFDKEDRGQVVIRKAKQVKSEVATALLSARFSKLQHTQFEVLAKDQFIFYPQKGSAGTVQKAEISVNEKSEEINKVVLHHLNGNKATIELSGIELGAKIDNKEFEFTIPPDTDQVEPAVD